MEIKIIIILLIMCTFCGLIGYWVGLDNESDIKNVEDDSTYLYMSDILYPGFYFDKKNCTIWIDEDVELVWDIEPEAKILRDYYKCYGIQIIQPCDEGD